MNKKVNTIIWIIAICTVFIAAYTFYAKYKPLSLVIQPQNAKANQYSPSNNPTVPDFSLKDLNGKVVRLSDYNGKIVILNFFTVWCKYCKQEMPDLNELNMELEKDKAAILLAVDVQEPISTVRSYFAINNLDLNVILDQDGSVTQKYGISGFPTTLIINKDGTLYTYISGRTDKKTLTDILNKINRGEPAQ
jgi:peroxiredoxin